MSEMETGVRGAAPVLRNLLVGLLVVIAVVLQLSVAPAFAIRGITPDLALLVVLAVALTRGGQAAIVTGFAAGVLLDLAPPADHTAGRWALALLIVGYVAGRVREGSAVHGRQNRPSAMIVMATVAACSFIGVSVFAVSGLILGEAPLTLLPTVAISVGYDLLLAPLLIPALLWLLGKGDL
ncbi:rod shape-determining protein MreD [Nocardioides albertanoniae]|uniref:Rod shape-determining protein MreD n=1 Tax=Nocardioides albertanoniae TaxID=1175486 RepID=A0A543AAE7_9ACTN|nr:rod shape-determining protein MreD [Nocardioides albertanoniae]TQL69577.1 rod shape-determining protein MreD [Nocardioides albertanoniae]